MAILVGDTYVRETSYAKAKAHVENSKADTTGEVLKELKQQFPELNINSGTFSGKATRSSGINNVTIAPNILQEMADDPEKRIEYESLLEDIKHTLKAVENRVYPGGGKCVYREVFIHSNGEVGSISISQSGGGDSNTSIAKLPKDNRESWQERLMKSLEKKREKAREAEKEEAQRLAEKKVREAMLETEDGHLDVTI